MHVTVPSQSRARYVRSRRLEDATSSARGQEDSSITCDRTAPMRCQARLLVRRCDARALALDQALRRAAAWPALHRVRPDVLNRSDGQGPVLRMGPRASEREADTTSALLGDTVPPSSLQVQVQVGAKVFGCGTCATYDLLRSD